MLEAPVSSAAVQVVGKNHVPPHASAQPLGVRAARAARSWLHVPYHWGGESRSGVDCSGLVVAVYRKLGVTLPHQSEELWRDLKRVRLRDLRPGDIIAFGHRGISDHVGMYLGAGRFIHAIGAGKGVRIELLRTAGKRLGLMGAVRPAPPRRRHHHAAHLTWKPVPVPVSVRARRVH